MKILHLNLKKKWFDMILSGEKKEEYREIKPHWEARLIESCLFGETKFIDYTHILFMNGYSSVAPRFLIELNSIRYDLGVPIWGAELGRQYFVLSLGEIISTPDDYWKAAIEEAKQNF